MIATLLIIVDGWILYNFCSSLFSYNFNIWISNIAGSDISGMYVAQNVQKKNRLYRKWKKFTKSWISRDQQKTYLIDCYTAIIAVCFAGIYIVYVR